MVRSVLFAHVLVLSSAMKLHDVVNRTLETSDCRLGTEKFVDSLSKDLEKSLGYDGMFYKGCLDFLHFNAKPEIPMMAQIEAFGERCKKALFVKDESAMHQVDPNQLEAECDRAVYNMDIQFRLLGSDALKTAEEFCAVFVDMVLPVDEEPECMRFIEDISMAHSEFLGTTHSWPAVIHKPHFEEAFMQACLENKKLESEEDGTHIDYGDGARDCQMKMNRLQAMPLDKHYKLLSKFFADVCPMLGMELPDHRKPTPLRKTSRGFKAALFQRAAKIAAENNMTNLTTGKKRKPAFSALQVHLLDEAVAGKGGGDSRRRRRRRRRLNHKQSTCCDQAARTYEVGLTASAGVAVGYTQIGAEGYQRWRGNDCEYKWGVMGEACVGVSMGVGVDVTVSVGFFNSYDDIKGRAYFLGGGVCFFGWAGGTTIGTQLVGGKEIGKTIDTGGGMGIDAGGGYCEAWQMSEHREWIRRVKKKCPSGGGCFPGHAVVRTPGGLKPISQLQVGDQVLSVDAAGKLIYDDIYFFGHAERSAWAPFVNLKLQAPEGLLQWNLELTPDHFIQMCQANCSWEESRTVPAEQVLPGHHVWVVTDSGRLEIALVISTQLVPGSGLYNPYTLTGNIVVNGVVASSHSSWLLDAWMPLEFQHHLPAIYQQTFILGRCLYHLFGPAAADAIGVNNNGELPKEATSSAHLLAAVTILAAASQVLLSIAAVTALSKWSWQRVPKML